MKTKKMILIMAMVCGLAMLGAITALAAPAWHTCEVVKTGAGWGNVYIRVHETSSAFPDKTCLALASQEKEMLAVALTAKANNRNVQAFFDKDLSTPTIHGMYLL